MQEAIFRWPERSVRVPIDGEVWMSLRRSLEDHRGAADVGRGTDDLSGVPVVCLHDA